MRRTGREDIEHVLDVDHADDRIERVAIDRQPAVPGAREGSHQIVEGNALFDRDNVRAWHADIAGVAFTEVEQVAHHLAFERREIALGVGAGRSEEHTSELQSLMRISYAVFCLKKKTTDK